MVGPDVATFTKHNALYELAEYDFPQIMGTLESVCVCVYLSSWMLINAHFFVSLCTEASIYTHTARNYLCRNSLATCRTRSDSSLKAVTYSSELSQH